jgi:RNA polymerase sigma-70 factor (ECF subfamily)
MSEQERDLRCIERLRLGDESALGELYDRYTPLLFPVTLRILGNATDAEDALQHAWLQAWRSASSYDSSRGTVAGWLLTMARTRALDMRRSRVSRLRAEEAPYVPAPASPVSPSHGAEHTSLRLRLAQALESLEPAQRQVLEIAYFEGLSQSEIAARLGAPLGTVKSWTRQGLQKLRAQMPKEEWT